jgi:hypothetical protein
VVQALIEEKAHHWQQLCQKLQCCILQHNAIIVAARLQLIMIHSLFFFPAFL